MTSFKSSFLRELAERGIMKDCTAAAELDDRLSRGSITAYAGFDATADSLHAGHLLTLTTLRRLAGSGHRVIALVGGATSQVGDPSFRDSSRPVMDEETIGRNIAGISRDIRSVLADVSDRVEIMDNAQWLGSVGFLEFMRDVGTHFSVSRMLSMESVRGRLDGGNSLSALEFSYMMLQAADFAELAKRRDCILQIGGSDQWGNIVNGIELARRRDGRALFGLTTDLLTTSDGRKMGKTARGAAWLSPEKLTPFGFWQFWRNAADVDVGRLLAMLTEKPVKEIAGLVSSQENMNFAKVELADAMTALVHGRSSAAAARREAEALFAAGAQGDSDVPETPIACRAGGKGVLEVIVELGFARSNGEARRLVEAGAVRLSGERLTCAARRLTPHDGTLLLSVGKRRRKMVRMVAQT